MNRMPVLVRPATLALSLTAALGSCSITDAVEPVQRCDPIERVYVLRNESVHMGEFHDALCRAFEDQGVPTETVDGHLTDDMPITATYTANWKWDMAMYLSYFEVTLREDRRPIGRAEYDARSGSFNMSKFGRTEQKIRPLITELLAEVPRGDAVHEESDTTTPVDGQEVDPSDSEVLGSDGPSS